MRENLIWFWEMNCLLSIPYVLKFIIQVHSKLNVLDIIQDFWNQIIFKHLSGMIVKCFDRLKN